MTWDSAMAWADQLVYGGYSDWRLPDTANYSPLNLFPDSYSTDGSTYHGYNFSAPGAVNAGSKESEMAYTYYNSLGNLGGRTLNGDLQDSPYLNGIDTGPFMDLRSYWSATVVEPFPGAEEPSGRMYFSFSDGYQGYQSAADPHYRAWAVRDGDSYYAAPVPEPASMILFGAGLIGLAGIGRRRFTQ